jgi:hypothetical protein
MITSIPLSQVLSLVTYSVLLLSGPFRSLYSGCFPLSLSRNPLPFLCIFSSLFHLDGYISEKGIMMVIVIRTAVMVVVEVTNALDWEW